MSAGISKTKSWIALAAIGTIALAGCGNASNATPSTQKAPAQAGVEVNPYAGQALKLGEPKQGGDLTFGMGIGVENLDPTGPIGSSIALVDFQIYDQLLKFDPEGNAVPELAESLTSEDMVEWTMKLPSGVTFHDGTAFNAEAVVAHVKRVAAEGSKSLSSGEARRIKTMETPDENTVVFTVDQKWATFPSIFAFGSLAMVPSPTAVEKHGDKFGLNPVGVGPFKVTAFSPAGKITLAKFEDYRLDDVPYLDTLTFLPALESASRLSAVTTGDLDAGATRVAAQFDEARAAGLTVLEQPQFKSYQLMLNHKDPALADQRVREALNSGVDRNALNAAVFGGKHQVMTGLMTPSHPRAAEAGWPTFDKEKAAGLISEYEAEHGELTLDFLIPQGAEFADMTAILQQMYKDIGLEINYTAATPPTLITSGAAGDYQVQMREPAFMPETIEGLAAAYAEGAGANQSHGSDPKIDALLTKAHTTADPKEREAVILELQEALAEWLPAVPLLSTTSGFMVGPDVQMFPGSFPNTSYEMFDARYVSVK